MAVAELEELFDMFDGMASKAEVEAAWDGTTGSNLKRLRQSIQMITNSTALDSSDDDNDAPPRRQQAATGPVRPPPVPAYVPRAGPSALANGHRNKDDIISISSSDEDEVSVVGSSSSKKKLKAKRPAPVKGAAGPSKSAPNNVALHSVFQPARPPPPRPPALAQPHRSPAPHMDALDAPSSPSLSGRTATGPQSESGSVVLPPSPPLEEGDSPHTIALNALISTLTDIDAVFASTVVAGLIAKGHQQSDQIVDLALEEIFGNPKGYPKQSQKRKRDGNDDQDGGSTSPSKKAKGKTVEIDYMSENRNGSGEDYLKLSFESLYEEFEYIPLDFIKKTFFKTALYVPTYFALKKASEMDPRPYKTKLVPYKSKGKARAKFNAEWDAERNWLSDRLRQDRELQDVKLAEELRQKEVEESGEGIECGCCFGTAPFEKCGQCDEGHLFCTDCIEAHANNELGGQKTDILCMDADGCKAPFGESELARTLPTKTLSLLHRLVQQKHIKESGLELDSCPFCDFSICIENPDEKLFVCQNDDCAVVSCRSCKREEHLPKSCEEMAKDNKLDFRHLVEEEMTKALIRICPNPTCRKPAVKEAGCNKMSCNVCRTLFCYVCSEVVKDYSHFDQQPDAYHRPKDGKKCPLWEDMNVRHAKEVKEARDRAKATLRARGEDIAEEDIDVELPDAAPALAPGVIAAGLPHAPRPLPMVPPPAREVAHVGRPHWPFAPNAAIEYARLIAARDFAGARALLGPHADMMLAGRPPLPAAYAEPLPPPPPLPRPRPVAPKRPIAAKPKRK